MAAISQTALLNAFSLTKLIIFIKILLKFVSKDLINNIPAIIGSDNGLALTRQ